MSMDALRLYGRYVGVSVRTQLQYRASFLLQTLSQFLITFGEFLGLAALFQRFGKLQGWTLPEMALLYGILSTSFALAEAIPRAFDVFPRYVKSGEFDRMLLRPRGTVLQLLGAEFQLMRLGRLSQALFVLAWALVKLNLAWSIPKILLLVLAIVGGACLFTGLFILAAVLCFWTVESVELVNSVTYGGIEAGQFPLSIYRSGFRLFFTFVVPIAAVNFIPAQILLGRSGEGGAAWYLHFAPLAGVAFLAACLFLWRLGVRRYASTGS